MIPKLKAKWPPNASKDIFIQQDNAKPHLATDDAHFRAVAESDGFNIKLYCQPPNSPDTNVLDLGFFSSIQGLQQKKKAMTVPDLMQNVNQAFEELSHISLNKVFLSLQMCCVEILKAKGGNQFPLPHMGKDRLARQGLLPDFIEVDEELTRECIEMLMEIQGSGQTTYHMETLMNDLGY